MGLGPLNAIYQARFMRYLENRGIIPPGPHARFGRLLGDGETDEPESMGSLTLASREKLDNLIFVVNCNLQRLDGPVRGNGKIIQELEAAFRGAGWNVIKVIWGSDWDRLLARDKSGLLVKRMEEVRGRRVPDFQGQGRRLHPQRVLRQVSRAAGTGCRHERRRTAPPHARRPRSAEGLQRLQARRGTPGRPTVILAKTVKGYGLGSAEARNATHQEKKLADQALTAFRSRFAIPIPEKAAQEGSLYRPPDDSPEIVYARSAARSSADSCCCARFRRRASRLRR